MYIKCILISSLFRAHDLVTRAHDLVSRAHD